jgi:hypothetical protein
MWFDGAKPMGSWRQEAEKMGGQTRDELQSIDGRTGGWAVGFLMFRSAPGEP